MKKDFESLLYRQQVMPTQKMQCIFCIEDFKKKKKMPTQKMQCIFSQGFEY